MPRKLSMGLVPVLAIAALAVPAVAQAANSHWYKNASEIGDPSEGGVPGEKIPVVSWGELAFKANNAGAGIELGCKTVVGGFVTNSGTAEELEKKEGGFGEGATQQFASYECTSNFCKGGTRPAALSVQNSLPWPSAIESKEGIRVNNTGVEIELGCFEPPEFKFNATTYVTSPTAKWNPLGPSGVKKGTSAASPGITVFDEKAGELELKGSGGVVKVRTTGSLATLGYAERELINIKTP